MLELSPKNRPTLRMSVCIILRNRFPKNFVGYTRSFIISLRHINDFTNEAVAIGQKEIPIGKQYRQSFIEKAAVIVTDDKITPEKPDQRGSIAELLTKHTLIVFIIDNFLTS